MSNDKPTPAHPDQDLVHHAIEAVRPFFMKNGLHILLVLVAVVLIIVLVKTRSYRAQRWARDGWEAVATAPDPLMLVRYPDREAEALRKAGIDQCRRVLAGGPETPATPWLLLKAAGLHAFGEEWDAARRAYERVLDEHGDSPAADMARAGLARTLEESGQYAEAADHYGALAAAGRPGHLLDAGRCMELAGDAAAAESHYRGFLDIGGPESGMAGLARAGLERALSGELLTPPPPKPKPPELPAGGPLVIPADTEVGLGQFAVPAETP